MPWSVTTFTNLKIVMNVIVDVLQSFPRSISETLLDNARYLTFHNFEALCGLAQSKTSD